MYQTIGQLLRNNTTHASQFHNRFDDVQDGQRPEAVTVCCSDSRVLQDHMWANDVPGRLFTCSNIGNRVRQRTEAGPVVAGDVLYPLVHTDTDLAVVVGHTGCGAVTAAYDDLTGGVDAPPGIRHCLDLLTPDLAAGVDALPADVDRMGAVSRLVEYNVDRQVEHLLASEDVPVGVTVVGAVYDFQDVYSGRRGEVHVINVEGETEVDALREMYPEIEGRFERLRAY